MVFNIKNTPDTALISGKVRKTGDSGQEKIV